MTLSIRDLVGSSFIHGPLKVNLLLIHQHLKLFVPLSHLIGKERIKKDAEKHRIVKQNSGEKQDKESTQQNNMLKIMIIHIRNRKVFKCEIFSVGSNSQTWKKF